MRVRACGCPFASVQLRFGPLSHRQPRARHPPLNETPVPPDVVYGQDADLLLLALLSHEPYFVVMREWFDQVRGFVCVGHRRLTRAGTRYARRRAPIRRAGPLCKHSQL